ncbi:MAG: site-2 protease family protein [Fimbriimonadaceae bacterium]|nr:site-2 protease family protein [Fimbriimonadaceae bacterium]
MTTLPPEAFLAIGIVIFFGLGLHEYAHAKFADMAGDPTPRYYGRVTLNLFKHFDPLGALMIAITAISGFGIGWGKPVPMDPRKMRNPKWDHFMAVAAGPLSNLLQAVVWAIILRALLASGVHFNNFAGMLCLFGVTVNLSLCFFNLIPLGPLDGHWLIGTFMPENMRAKWYLWNRQMGSFLLLGIVILGQLSNTSVIARVIGPPIRFFFSLLVGTRMDMF